MAFRPTFCPNTHCPTRTHTRPFTYQRRGYFRRKCDGRTVQRFSCRSCAQRFSSQTFRFDYRWRKPRLHLRVFDLFVSKVTMRQMARITRVRRPTVERRLLRIGSHCKEFHRFVLHEAGRAGLLQGVFQLDELETFETDRRLKPVTMPVLIERHSYFVVYGSTAPLGARGRLAPHLKKRKERYEAAEGRRRSGSVRAVRECLSEWARVHRRGVGMHLQSDRKSSYRRLFLQAAGDQFGSHTTESSRRRRDYGNLLFPINHTLAMMRDGISRLVRRSWGAAKLRERLEVHFWIWAAYRNYVRGVTVRTRVTPAQALGVVSGRYLPEQLLYWRWPEWMHTYGQ